MDEFTKGPEQSSFISLGNNTNNGIAPKKYNINQRSNIKLLDCEHVCKLPHSQIILKTLTTDDVSVLLEL